MYTSGDTQAVYVDEGVTDLPREVASGGRLVTFYGSWTTANGVIETYVGRPAWWCIQSDVAVAPDATFDYYGEVVPEALTWFTEATTDEDGDGVDDDVDWAGPYGVQAQYNVWQWQADQVVLTAGKIAETSGSGVLVTLTARNLGDLAGAGTITDTIPAGWSFGSASVSPDTETPNGDGTTTLTWSVALDGMTTGSTIDMEQLTYTISRDTTGDVSYLELPAARIDFDDGGTARTNDSFPAAVYGIDVDGDGVVSCGEDEVCDGVDNDLDGDVDEGFDEDGDGWTTCEGDCDDDNPVIWPGAFEECDGWDNDCDGLLPEDESDADGDGFIACLDCDDGDAAAYPGAEEICDGLDDNCDGTIPPVEVDADADGFRACDDCDDGNPDVCPGAPEACDGLDSDCDGAIPPVEVDADNDGWRACLDCVDTDLLIHPGAGEACNGMDDDCDGDVDEGFDADGDGWTSCEGDCDDGNAGVNPGAPEICNGFDDNCDLRVDDGFDRDGDGWTTCAGDCDDTNTGVHPGAPEVCDGLDDDCDGVVPSWEVDADNDGWRACQECDDGDLMVHPGAPEVCNGVDDDCDGNVPPDEADGDGDGWRFCEECDDYDASVNPAAAEVCNEVDDDCDLLWDEDDVCVSECPEPEPPDCWTLWQAEALGYLDIVSTGSLGEGISFTNDGLFDVCLDEQAVYIGDRTQAFYVDDAVIDVPVRVEPGDTFTAWYASWTTANGHTETYLGEYGWWCLELGQAVRSGASFEYFGEEAPEALRAFTDGPVDTDGDGVDDDAYWAGAYGVQSQYSVWDWQADYAVLTAGKTAIASGSGVEVTLTVRNLGAVAATGTLTDSIPAGWTLGSTTVAPDSATVESDGSTTIVWTVTAATGGTTAGAPEEITYAIAWDAGTDVAYLELSEATIDFFDGASAHTNWSLPAAVFQLDTDGDGTVDCRPEECDGVDNDGDIAIDEDFDSDGDGEPECE